MILRTKQRTIVLLFLGYLYARSRKSQKASVSFRLCPSVLTSTYIKYAPIERISAKFYAGEFYENLLKEIQVWLKSRNNMGHFTRRSKQAGTGKKNAYAEKPNVALKVFYVFHNTYFYVQSTLIGLSNARKLCNR